MTMPYNAMDAAMDALSREMQAEQVGRQAAERVQREQHAASVQGRERAELEHKIRLLNTELSFAHRRLTALNAELRV